MKKVNNKGFSLIELIIVIAILAILIAVLAPQFIRYVERGRVSSDITIGEDMLAAAQVAYADDQSAATAVGTVASVSAGGMTAHADLNEAFNTTFGAGWGATELRARAHQAATVQYAVSADANGNVKGTWIGTNN